MLQYAKRPPLRSGVSSAITDKVGGVWDKNEINVVYSRKLSRTGCLRSDPAGTMHYLADPGRGHCD